MAAVKEVLERINQQIEEQEDDVQEISLDQIHFTKFTSEISELLEKHKDTILFLSLNDCALNSLEGFPNLPKLVRLELTDNKISGKELAQFSQFTSLQSLSLGGNPVQDVSDLEALKGLSTLVQLDLFGCPISEKADYRDKIFAIFEGLEILDNQDKEGNDVDYDEDEEGEGEEGEDDEDASEGEEEDEEDDEDDEDSEDEKPKKKAKRN